MLKKLELTEAHKKFIQRVCELEHETLIRCHNHDEDYLDRLAEYLNAERITLKEYHKELSNAFYEFQVVLENPEQINEMSGHYFDIFYGMMGIYNKELQDEFPDIFWPFLNHLETLKNLKNLNPFENLN